MIAQTISPIATAIPKAVCRSRRGFFGCVALSVRARFATTATAIKATPQATPTHAEGNTVALKSSRPMLRIRVI